MALTSMFSYVFGSCMPAFCMLGLLYALVLDLSIVEQCLPRVTVFPWHNGHIGFFFSGQTSPSAMRFNWDWLERQKYFKHIQFAQTGIVFAKLLLHHQSAFSTALHNFTLMDRKPHVAIIGAGMAGLRCADILIQNGVKVTLFEARNRVGGRVCYFECEW